MAKQLNRFNGVAPFYTILSRAVFGTALMEAQCAFNHQLSQASSILIVGGGSGEFLKHLLNAPYTGVVHYVEASSRMIAMSKKLNGDRANVLYIHGTERDIPHQRYDAVVANFFFDLFDERELHVVVDKLISHLGTSGNLMVADFYRTRRLPHRMTERLMYIFFRLCCQIQGDQLPDWNHLFERHHLKIEKELSFARGFIRSWILSRVSS